MLAEAVYGIPEIYADKIKDARIVANPGCYATSVILALRPLTDAGWIAADSGVVCDCKSGASGAGKELRRDLQFVEVDDNFKAYNLFSHRHTPEILEHTGLPETRVVFSTHLLPVSRGILSTIYVNLESPQEALGHRSAVSQILCWTADGADLERRVAAGAPTCNAH